MTSTTATSSDNWKSIFAACANAVRPPEKYKPSDWAERNFTLPPKGNAQPGQFKFSRTPYLRGVVDALAEPGVEDVVFVKPTRVGGTTAGQIILGYWIDNDPGNCLTVMPSEAAAEEEIKDRVRPLLQVPALKPHVSPDPHKNTLSRIELDTMDIYTGWAGSPQSLGSRTCRYVRFDEVDKFPPFAGREADPISLGKERTATFGHRKRHYITSTPTTREGAVWRAWESCGDRRRFYVPCPHCGTYQVLTWPQVKWPKLSIPDKVALADEIERSRLAWYECGNPDCKGRIEESHKPKMLERGVWASEGQTVRPDGTLEGDRPVSRRVGFHLSSLYSPWRKFHEMAAEWIRADGDIAASMNFRNSRLAEPFETQLSATEPHVIREKAEKHGGEPNQVPEWAVGLYATADVQKDRLYFVIRAWGYGFRSALVRYGSVLTFDGLWQEVFETPCLVGTRHVFPEILACDDQYRRNEVVEFQKRDVRRIYRAHGLSTYAAPLAHFKVQDGVGVLNINTLLSKDRLSDMIHDGDPERWTPHRDADDDYCRQVVAEQKVWDQQQKMELWKPKTMKAANHYLDCEAIQCALASHRHMDVPPPAASEQARSGETTPKNVSPSEFMSRGRGRW